MVVSRCLLSKCFCERSEIGEVAFDEVDLCLLVFLAARRDQEHEAQIVVNKVIDALLSNTTLPEELISAGVSDVWIR